MLNEIQQNLLHYLSLVHISSLKDALEAYVDIKSCQEERSACDEEELLNQILCINDTLRTYDLEIIQGIDEITSQKVIVLANTADNNITQKAKFYDQGTSQLFSKILQACIMSENGQVSEIDCLNLNKEVNISKTAAETAISKLVKDKWLVSNAAGRLSLGMRSVLELEPSMKHHYPDHVKSCPLCKMFLVQGSICSNCSSRIHFHCLEKYLKKTKKCPNCKSNWKESDAGNASLEQDDDEDSGDENEGVIPKSEEDEPASPLPPKRKRGHPCRI